jgi:hypothetical protein
MRRLAGLGWRRSGRPAAGRNPAGLRSLYRLPAGSPWIYLTVTSAAVLLTVGVTRLATRLVNTDPGPRSGAVLP